VLLLPVIGTIHVALIGDTGKSGGSVRLVANHGSNVALDDLEIVRGPGATPGSTN
jgi:hypothetical protein